MLCIIPKLFWHILIVPSSSWGSIVYRPIGILIGYKIKIHSRTPKIWKNVSNVCKILIKWLTFQINFTFEHLSFYLRSIVWFNLLLMLASNGLYSCRRNMMYSAVFRNNFSKFYWIILEIIDDEKIELPEIITGRFKSIFCRSLTVAKMNRT